MTSRPLPSVFIALWVLGNQAAVSAVPTRVLSCKATVDSMCSSSHSSIRPLPVSLATGELGEALKQDGRVTVSCTRYAVLELLVC